MSHPTSLPQQRYALHPDSLQRQPSIIDPDLSQVFRSVGNDGMMLDARETSTLERLVRFGLAANSHADLLLSSVFLELEHLHSTEARAFITRALPSVATALFHSCSALTRILGDITIARRRQVLRPTSGHMYHGEFLHAPWHDTHLFSGVSSAVLEKVSKNPHAWRVPPPPVARFSYVRQSTRAPSIRRQRPTPQVSTSGQVNRPSNDVPMMRRRFSRARRPNTGALPYNRPTGRRQGQRP